MTDLRPHMNGTERREYDAAERQALSHRALASGAVAKMNKIRRAVRARLRRKAEKQEKEI